MKNGYLKDVNLIADTKPRKYFEWLFRASAEKTFILSLNLIRIKAGLRTETKLVVKRANIPIVLIRYS